VELAVGTRLGGGQQGEVLQVSDENHTNCCLKIMRNRREFEHELEVLVRLQPVSGVVRYVGCKVNTNTIMMSPVLKKTLQDYKGDAACLRTAWGQLVDVFQAVHDQGYAYRDVRGSNILVKELDSSHGFQCRVYLTDFGTASLLDEPIVYEGTLRHGAGSILGTLENHGRTHPVACSRKTDLESLVKMMYILEEKRSTSLDSINPLAKDGCKKLRAWWEETEERIQDGITSWRLQVAREANYDALK
jgi:serine/threonine protein kinase